LDDTTSTHSHLENYTNDYVKRLLIERRYIYAKLYNPGGSVILRASDVVDHDRQVGYSTDIGNTFHLDLIQLEQELQRLIDEKHCSKKEIQALLTWADGLTAQQAADFLAMRGAVSVRKLRERGLHKLRERMAHGEGEKLRGTGDRTFRRRRQEETHDSIQDGDTGREKAIDDITSRDADVKVEQG